MRAILTLLALLLSFSVATAQTFPGPGTNNLPLVSLGSGSLPVYKALTNAGLATMPADTVKCNNTGSTASPADCLLIVLPQTNKWFANDSPPANITRIGDRVLIGDAANYLATSGNPCGNDWFSNFEGTTLPNTCGGYTPFAQLVVESGGSGQNSNSSLAILGAAQTANAGGAGAAMIGISGFGVANDSVGAFAWGGYFECDYTNASAGGCNTVEIENSTFINNTGDVDAFSFNAKTVAVNIGCGSGLTSPAEYTCGSAISIGSNPAQFANGIRFGGDPIAVGSAGVKNAINMPTTYQIVWNSGSSTIAGSVYVGSSQRLNLDGVNGLTHNGNNGVSCTGINTTTFRSVDGLVTAC